MSSLTKLNAALGDYTNKELSLLERKNNELIKEFNRLINDAKLKKKYLDGLVKTEQQ